MNKKGINHISAIAGGILILSGLLASGCNKRKEVLNEKEMVDLITDLKLAEAYTNSQMGGPHHAENREELANSILAEHKVTREQLDSTLGWYGKNLDKYAELYEKVDKKLLAKRKRLMKDTEKNVAQEDGNNLWPLAKNGVISSLGTNDGLILSLIEPELSVGDRLEWTMHIKESAEPLTGVLGVEYADGTSEAVTSNFNNRQHLELSLQTDTSKSVSRIYGTMRRKNMEIQPLFIDSIMLHKIPYDSIEYNKYRSQKKYGYPVRITQEDRRQKHIADSLRQDSIKQASKIRRDSLNRVSQQTVLPKDTKPTAPNKPSKPIRPGKSSSSVR